MSRKFNQPIQNDKSSQHRKKLSSSSPSLPKIPPPCIPPTRHFTDIQQCYEAANDLANLITSGDTTHKKTIRSLAKAIEKFKTQIETQIGHVEVQTDEEKLHSFLAANDALSGALKTYKRYKRKLREPRSQSGEVREELKLNEYPDPADTESIFHRRSKNLTSRYIKRCPTTPLSLLRKPPAFLPSQHEPKPKPTPYISNSDSSMSESGCDTPDLLNMTPDSFAKNIELDFEVEGVPSDESPRVSGYTSDKVRALQKKIEKLNFVNCNQDISINSLRRKLQTKTDRVRELKAEKKELDAYITSLNGKFEKLKEDTVNVKAAEEHMNALNKLIEDRETKLEECKSKIRHLEEYIEDMKLLVNSKQENLDKNKEQIQEMQEYIVRLNNLVETHEKQEEEFKKKLSSKEQYILDIKDEVTAKTELIKDLSIQLQESQEEIQSLKAQLAKLEESKIESEPSTPEIKDMTRSHLDFSARFRHEELESKSLDTTLIIPQAQVHSPIRPNLKENSRFTKFLEESKSQAITDSGLKRTERKQTISPVTLIHGDDETVSSQSDYSDREADMNEEDAEIRDEESSEKEGSITQEIKLSDMVVNKEIQSFMSSRNPFMTGQMTSRSLIASMDFAENPQNYEASHLFRMCVNKRKGILYADADIEVGVTSLTNSSSGCVKIYIGNKADFPIQSIETKIYNVNKPQTLQAKIDIIRDSSILANLTKLERSITYEIKGEFSSSPQLLIKYVQNDAVVRHSIFLPITFALSLESLEIEPDVAFAEYKKLRGYETLKRVQKLQNRLSSLYELAWFVHFSGNSKVFTVREIPEISSRSVMFCCKYLQEKVFYILTFDESSESLEICIRSKSSKLRECLIPLLSKMISSES